MFAFVLRPSKSDGSILKIRLFGLVANVSWSRLLSWPLSSLPEPYPTLLPPPLDLSPRRASLCHRPKSCSSALCSPECFLADQQKTHWVSPALAGDHVLLLLPRKPDGPIWHSGLFGFPALLVADVSVTVISCVVASVTKTLSRSWSS
jgi:hypothetical protein